MIRIQSDHHGLFTITQKKITLSSFDDKRYICDDSINTYAYGHWRIKNQQFPEEHKDFNTEE